ncbi:hexokinase [Trichophyton tonsurans CBS 112818]|uniref:Phosphotransferase n=2 Tax=Trichophyton TaxID=5550 RepID=F2PUG9_TRIEC|nr:hexokinase [Trichophyton tonsurans CBS 112818]EGE05537.1 hexokinase XprF [Trichophyton equinum CBS 127.97]
MSVLSSSDDDEHYCRTIDTFLRPLTITDATLYELSYRLSKVYRTLALTGDGHFFPTPVTRLPSGRETGVYLAVDVGMTNLRVAFIELLGCSSASCHSPGGLSDQSAFRSVSGRRVRRTIEKAWRIEERLKEDNEEALFGWIGSCIAEVVADELTSHDSADQSLPREIETGISFSLPIRQESLDEATLMPIGKGFAIKSNLNLRRAVLDGYERHSYQPNQGQRQSQTKRRKTYALPDLNIIAIANDTVATLVSLAYAVKSLPNTRVAMGIVVGTGCNATIPMQLKDLHQTKACQIRSYCPEATEAVISTEWTLQGTEGPLKELSISTAWDDQLSACSVRPGFQPFEYMTGGRYIGELIRIIVYDYYTTVMSYPSAVLPCALTKPYALTIDFVSDVIATSRSDSELAARLSRKLASPVKNSWLWTPASARVLRVTASAVQTRSAALIAAASVALLACNHEIRLECPQRCTSLGKLHSAASPYQNPLLLPASRSSANWQRGPEELVVAYTGSIIQHYPNFKVLCQGYIDRLVIRAGPQDGGKSVLLREATDGSIIGAGVLAGMIATGRGLWN